MIGRVPYIRTRPISGEIIFFSIGVCMFTIFKISNIVIQLGHSYRTRDGNTVVIKTTLNKHHPDFKSGFRFVDDHGRTYMPCGRWSTDPRPTSYDLIKELV